MIVGLYSLIAVGCTAVFSNTRLQEKPLFTAKL